MHFRHSNEIWAEYPELVPGALSVRGIGREAAVDTAITAFNARAEARLAGTSEGELPEIQAWRRTFSRMGLKPTQYRSASEALLRRFRKEGALPRIHPLIDLCNAVSLAFAVPVAVFDTDRIADWIEVRHAGGAETYLTFGGETEHPEPREVIFADAAGQAHARRWTNRQSGLSAVRDATSNVLIVAEALHGDAETDLPELLRSLTEAIMAAWPVAPRAAVLTPAAPRFEF